MKDKINLDLSKLKSTRGVKQKARERAREELWKRGEFLSLILDETQQGMVNDFKTSESLFYIWLCSRRLGKCIIEGTKVTTLNRGIVSIEKLVPGDKVWGYNKDGSVSPTNVVNVFEQGEKEVVDLVHNDHIIASSTLDHTWLTYNTHTKKTTEKKVKDFNSRDKIVRKSPGQSQGKEVRDAYTLGVLLGDGNSTCGENVIYLSSVDSNIPSRCAEIVNCEVYKNGTATQNYTWVMSDTPRATSGYEKKSKTLPSVSFYTDWCKGRKAHQKFVDLEEVKTWDRDSKIKLLTGIIDSDGSLGISKKSLVFQLSMQAKTVIDTVEYLFLELWGITLSRGLDDRTKYKNGPCHTLSLKHNALIRLAWQEITAYIVTDSKKWKPEFNNLTYQKSSEFSGAVVRNSRKEKTWDIEVDNDTHMYMLANGHITHNSVSLIGVAIEQALAKENSRILYLSKTTDNVTEIVDQASAVILKECPDTMSPDFSKKDNKFKFKNGSEIRIKGLDNTGPDVIRGVKADLIVLDEFCFMRNLDTLINSVIMPMVIECGGRILMGSTPPDTPGHDSISWIQKAEERGALTRKTIYDCPRWSNKQVRMFEKEAGGIHTDTFKREYMAQIVVSRSKAILTALTDEKLERLIQDVEPQDYIPQTYVSLDIGFRDLSVALFGWWDYDNARLIIQDEVVLKGSEATTDNIAKMISAKEYELWRHLPVYKRVCDTDPRLIEDLKKMSNLRFLPTKKDNKEAQVNQTNIMLTRNQLIVSPKCKTLLIHMRYGIWNDARTGFARTKALGHCDAIDALLYMIRNVDRGISPHENAPLHHTQAWIGTSQTKVVSQTVDSISKVFSRRK
jgi:hypothetical protein